MVDRKREILNKAKAQVLVNGVELLSAYCPNCGAKMDGKDGDA